MLKVGAPAPPIDAVASDGNRFVLDEQPGLCTVIYFFPKAFTPGCTVETKSFRKNFVEWKEVYVPQIYHTFSTRHLIVMEFISGIKVIDTDELRQAGHNPHQVVNLLAKTYLKQLLEDGFFHADPHAGNPGLFCNPTRSPFGPNPNRKH